MDQVMDNATDLRRSDHADPLYAMAAELAVLRERYLDRMQALLEVNHQPEQRKFRESIEQAMGDVDNGLGQLACDLDSVSGTHRAEWVLGEIVLPGEAPEGRAEADADADAGHNGNGNGNGAARPSVEAMTR